MCTHAQQRDHCKRRFFHSKTSKRNKKAHRSRHEDANPPSSTQRAIALARAWSLRMRRIVGGVELAPIPPPPPPSPTAPSFAVAIVVVIVSVSKCRSSISFVRNEEPTKQTTHDLRPCDSAVSAAIDCRSATYNTTNTTVKSLETDCQRQNGHL